MRRDDDHLLLLGSSRRARQLFNVVSQVAAFFTAACCIRTAKQPRTASAEHRDGKFQLDKTATPTGREGGSQPTLPDERRRTASRTSAPFAFS